jgi:phosphomannomutase
LNDGIFKAYDIRGLYPEELDAEAAAAIGRGIARFLGGGPVVVGRDMRESGLVLRETLIAGLRAEGAAVVDIGRVSTPMVYFATQALETAGGVMITASHNPGAYNGLKVCARHAVPVGGESGLREVAEHARALLGQALPEPGADLEACDVRERYYGSLLDMFPARPRLHAVIDAGNGIAGEAVDGLLEALPLEVTRLYFEPDGSFPNHEANPLDVETLADLRRKVVELGADLGVAFDGDGDRCAFVDETGEPVPADLMTALLCEAAARHGLLGVEPGTPIVYDLRSSRVVPETIRALGAVPVRGRVGHAFLKQIMRERGAAFGGELSGHFYFRFPSGYIGDDGAAAMMLGLQALDLGGRPFSELWRPFRRYCQSGEINSRVGNVPAALDRVRSRFADGESDELDGLTISFEDWWLNVRPSNTEPLLRLNVEAATESEMAKHRDEVLAAIRE